MILNIAALWAETFPLPWPATVKVNLLPVYSGPSVISGIVTFFKKEDRVEVRSELFNLEGKWCAVAESAQGAGLGFVNCGALESFSPPRENFDGEGKLPPLPSPPDDTLPAVGPLPSGPVGKNETHPSFGEFLMALWNRDTGRVADLLEQGIDPNGQTSYGTRPLLIAVKKENPDLLGILISHGADVDGRDRNGLTPLMAAASLGLAQNVRFLIDAGADVNSRDEKGLTPLMWATVSGHPRVVGILLANGAEVNAKTGEGLTARGLSQRINTGLQQSFVKIQERSGGKDLGRLRRKLAKHEEVLRLLEGAEAN